MMARSSNAPSIGRIQKRKTNFSKSIIFGLQRAAGPYRRAMNGLTPCHGARIAVSAQLSNDEFYDCGVHSSALAPASDCTRTSSAASSRAGPE